MTTLNEMWTRLEQHQPLADQRGYGAEWKIMCKQRTPEAAEAARAASDGSWAADAADAASEAAWWAAARDAASEAAWVAEAIEHINKAENN